MKFRKFGQVALALAVSLGIATGITSCSNSYTVGFLYVTGSQYNQVGAYKINNQTGRLTAVDKQPFGSGGTNPVRSLILSGGRFLYILNQGIYQYAPGNTDAPVASNVSLLQIGGAGILTPQATYPSQGTNSISFLTDSGGSHFYVLDEYETDTNGNIIPPTTSPTANTPCLNPANQLYYPVGDISAYSIDTNTGRLSPIINQQSTATLNYFPVGCFPTDFKVASTYIYTIQQGSAERNEFHTVPDSQTVFVYSLNSSNGQLSLTQNAPIQTNAGHLTYINTDPASRYVYILDAAFPSGNCTNDTQGISGATTAILQYTVNTGGALAPISTGVNCNDPTAINPTVLTANSTSKFVYVANAGPNTSQNNPASLITAFNVDSTSGLLHPIQGQPYSDGSGPRCIVEDPSNQFIYTVGFNDSRVTGKLIESNGGALTPLRGVATDYQTVGNPTWCVVSGRTQ